MKNYLITTIVIFFVCISLCACGNNEENKYTGMWENISDTNTYLYIQARDNGFIVTRYAPSDINGNIEKLEYPAKIDNNSMLVNIGYSSITVIYDKNEDMLIVAGDEHYKRTNKDRALNKINKIIENETNNKSLCKSLQKELNQKRKEITDNNEWNAYLDQFHKRVPKGCTIIGDGRSILDDFLMN